MNLHKNLILVHYKANSMYRIFPSNTKCSDKINKKDDLLRFANGTNIRAGLHAFSYASDLKE